MKQTGCKYEKKFYGEKIRCKKDGSIRSIGGGCRGCGCTHFKPTWAWKMMHGGWEK